LAWTIKIDKDVQRSMKKLDKQIAKRITTKLREISQLENPRQQGKGLTGNLSGLWRYRVGDYRIVADIEDNVLVILVVDIEHRSKVYKRKKNTKKKNSSS
jgi:mRNA interferase RelE/StbE